MDQVMKVVTAQPKDSVVTLTDWKGAEPGRADLTRMKEVAVYDRPYVKRAAFINGEHLPKVHQQHLESSRARTFANHVTKEEALDWLVADDKAADDATCSRVTSCGETNRHLPAHFLFIIRARSIARQPAGQSL